MGSNLAVFGHKTLGCPECHGHLVLRTGKLGNFYGCVNFPRCRATHGAHANGEPYGIPAGPETKRARMATHAAFDPLWRTALRLYEDVGAGARGKKQQLRILRTARRRAYEWLGDRLGLTRDECHIGRFDAATCARAIDACQGMTARRVRDWAKRGDMTQ